MRLRRASAIATSILFAMAPDAAPQPPDRRPVFRSRTEAVTVDVVVRDRAGKHVAGLTADDFEILEDGVVQRILGVEVRSAAARPAGGADVSTRTPAPVEPLVEGGSSAQAIVALIFHQLSPQARVGAISAAREMIASLPDDEYAGIFAVDLRLAVMTPFTRDRDVLDRALDELLRTPPVPTASVMGLGVAERDVPGGFLSPADSAAAEMRGRMASDTESDRRSGAQAASLHDVIARLARYPGRKSIVLFSDGLDVSPRLESVIARALDENVTVYSVSAGGLLAGRRFSVPDRTVDSRSLTSTNKRGRESWRTSFLAMDPTAGLGPLASLTGGFLVSDTNDLRSALASINDDRHTYYVLGYSSSNDTLDDAARRIEVRVRRPRVSVRARTGYIAGTPGRE